jgi:hypothetical protein
MLPISAIPAFQNRMASVKQDADNSDIRAALENAIPLAVKQTKALAPSFKGKSEKETCKKIHDFLMTLRYKADGNDQNIKLPSALLKSKVADCKSFSLFTSAILTNLGIPHSLVYTSYDPNQPIPAHVYIITDSGCIIDAVWTKAGGKYGTEKKPNFKYIRPMNVNYLSGVGSYRGIGETALQRLARETKEKAAKIAAGAKSIGLSIPRQIVLGMYSLNIDGIATKAQNSKAALETSWKKIGGDPAALFAAIRDGASKPVKKLGFLDKLRSKIQELVAKKGVRLSGYGNGMCGVAEAEAAKKLLTNGGEISKQYQVALGVLGTSLGAAIGSIIPALGTAVGSAAGAGIATILYEQTPVFVDIIFQGGKPSTSPTPSSTPTTQPTAESDESGVEKAKFPIALVLGAAAVGAIILLSSKKK